MDRAKMKNSTGIMKVLAACAAIVMLAGGGALGSDENGGAAGGWLSAYRSARSLGFGGAFVAVADDPMGMVWNPAGMTQLFQSEVSLETSRLFEGTSVNCFSFAVPGSRYPTLGFTVLSLRSGDFERTNEFNETMGTFHEGDQAFLLSASHDLFPFLAVGANLKIVRQSIEDFNDTGAGLDLGMLVSVTDDLRIGASFANFGGPHIKLRESSEDYPVQFRGGFALRVLSGRATVTAQIDHLAGGETILQGGTEYWIHPTMALRVGFSAYSPAGGFSWSLPRDLRLDYGMSSHELGLTHRFSISYSFGGFFARSKAEPAVFSPFGINPVTKFNLSTRTRKDVESWKLEITDKFSRSIRSFGGRGTPPSHLMWDGKSAAGVAQPDGIYTFTLYVEDVDGRKIKGRRGTVEIDTSIPEISVPVVIDKISKE